MVGLALLCPLLAGIHDVPEHEVVVGSGSIGNAEFRDYFTVQTAQTLDRYERYVEPAARLADQSALHGSASGGNSPAAPGRGSLPTPDTARDRTPGLHGRLCPSVGDARALSSRHLRGAGPGRSCAPARAAGTDPRPGHRMARPGPRASLLREEASCGRHPLGDGWMPWFWRGRSAAIRRLGRAGARRPLAYSGRRRRSWQPTPAPPRVWTRRRRRIRRGAPWSPGTARR